MKITLGLLTLLGMMMWYGLHDDKPKHRTHPVHHMKHGQNHHGR